MTTNVNLMTILSLKMGRDLGAESVGLREWLIGKNRLTLDITGNDSTRDTRSSQYSEDRSYGSYGSEAKRKFQISSSSVGKVIGKGGQTIRDLQSRSGAKINIMKDSGNSYDTDVQLSGTNEQIDCAQKLSLI